MFHTNSSDVMNQISVVFNSLWPIYALVFGIMGARMLMEKGLKKIFPNYNPKKGKGRGNGKSTKGSSSRSNARSKSTGDDKRVRDWRSKGWMEKDSLKFTDKMLREYKPPRKSRR